MALVCLCRGNFYWPPHTTILFCSIFLDKIVLDTLKSRYHRSAPLGMEFVTVNLLLSTFQPIYAFFLTLMVNARHIFYGISMLEKYAGTGWKKFYLIFGMCDESFSINYTANIPEDVDRGWFMFFVTLLNHFYWFFGATLGGIFGSFLHFNTEGLEFVMTAMFVVIFMEQWLKEESHTSSLLGLGLSVLCLAVFGADQFILPAMAAILAVLTILRKPMERGEELQ